MRPETKSGKYKIEDFYRPSDLALEHIGGEYQDFYKYKNDRQSAYRQIQHKTLDDFWTESRMLFWNSTVTKSEDLEALGLDFSLPFVRKEVLDFTGRIVSLGISPQLSGDEMNMYSTQVLQAMYKKWRLKSKDKVEKFWQILYATMNGTICNYVGYDMDERDLRYLTESDRANNNFTMKDKKTKMWNDAFTEIVPLEEIYLKKIWERNIQKQGKTIRMKEMHIDDFRSEFPEAKYKNAEFVVPGNQIDEDSLFHKLLGGTQLLQSDKIQVMTSIDTDKDEKKVMANGIWLDELGKGVARPNPFTHKGQPYTWTVHEAIDDKFAYGMSMPFLLKDTTKILNTSYTMLVERELRSIDPPIITSDFEAPDLIFGQQRVVPVNDVNAYKEFQINDASGAYFTMMNSLQGMMSSFAQGGSSNIVPSIQPKSAKEINELEKMKQQALGNTLLMYYDLLHQEIFLLLKTMLQFYETGKYSANGNVVRNFSISNAPLSRGGVGTLEVKFVKNVSKDIDLYFEAVQKGIENGKTTEIIEMPMEVIQNLEVFIDEIKLEPEKSDEMERASFNEGVLQPMLDVFIPAGVADINKTYLRFLEKHGEHPSSFTSDQNIGQLMGGQPNQQQQQQMAMQQQAMGGGQGTGRQNSPAQQGNLNQSATGMKFGSQANKGLEQ